MTRANLIKSNQLLWKPTCLSPKILSQLQKDEDPIHGYSFPLEETSTSRAHNLSQVIRSVCSNEVARRTSHSTSLVFRKRYHVWIRRPCQVCVFVREPTARISRVLEAVVSSRSTFRGRWVHEFPCCFCPSS